MSSYTILLSTETVGRIRSYLSSLRSGELPGQRLAAVTQGSSFSDLNWEAFLEKLLHTKKPRIFAESEVVGDGSDWTARELSLLGDISVAMQVSVFDNGRHQQPEVHSEPFEATLLFTPGALLRSGSGSPPADWNEVVNAGVIDQEAYYRLYERRLLPSLRFANQVAAERGKPALVTIPGIGCGQFAGKFLGLLGEEFRSMLARLLEAHGAGLPNISTLYYDPFRECENDRVQIHGISYMVRPLLKGNESKPQLCRPEIYAEEGDDFRGHLLFSFVAWDHVSWPGNDFFAGDRTTDDGVKAAATSAMQQLTGLVGRYDPGAYCYRPPSPYQTWQQPIFERNLKLNAVGRLQIF